MYCTSNLIDILHCILIPAISGFFSFDTVYRGMVKVMVDSHSAIFIHFYIHSPFSMQTVGIANIFKCLALKYLRLADFPL